MGPGVQRCRHCRLLAADVGVALSLLRPHSQSQRQVRAPLPAIVLTRVVHSIRLKNSCFYRWKLIAVMMLSVIVLQ